MNLRKEIEKLLYWYIPAILIVYFISNPIINIIKDVENLQANTTSLEALILLGFILLIKHLHNVVIAIWLYSLARKMHHNYILWAFFGLISNLIAVIIFLILNLLEEKKSNSSTTTLSNDKNLSENNL